MAGADRREVEVVMAAVAGEGKEKEGGGRGKEKVVLPVGMVLVQLFTLTTVLLSKVVLNAGMHPFVLLVYRNLIAAAVVAPFAVVFEREMRKKVNLLVLGWISINATFGVVMAMGLYYYGLQATNASYSVNFLNLLPIVTFVIAVAFRAERLVLTNWPGKMKLLGTAMGVGGTMVVSLCRSRGRLLHLWPTHLLRPSSSSPSPPPAQQHLHRDMVAGTLFLFGSCLGYALWFIVQVRLARVFPSRYWATALTCLSGSLQSAVLGLAVTAGDMSAWRLRWDLQLFTVVYSGVFTTGVAFLLISWAIARRGPIYPSMFNSLSLVVTTVLDSVLLGTNVYLGSVVGTLLIVSGLYAFLWGKGKELAAAAAHSTKLQQQAGVDDGEQERCRRTTGVPPRVPEVMVTTALPSDQPS